MVCLLELAPVAWVAAKPLCTPLSIQLALSLFQRTPGRGSNRDRPELRPEPGRYRMFCPATYGCPFHLSLVRSIKTSCTMLAFPAPDIAGYGTQPHVGYAPSPADQPATNGQDHRRTSLIRHRCRCHHRASRHDRHARNGRRSDSTRACWRQRGAPRPPGLSYS